MDFVFDIDKTIAAAAYVAKRFRNQEISIFLLLKIMYGAERDALAKWHRPITGDSFASMRKGPVLSRTYDLIKGTVSSTNSDMVKWSEHFSSRSGNKIKLIAEANLDALSKREVAVLEESLREIVALIKKKGLIADALHERWPEWKDPSKYGRGSVPLSLEDVLSEVVEDEFQIEKIVHEIRSVSSAKAALQVAD
jgi:uncharacterized phage-associated protein